MSPFPAFLWAPHPISQKLESTRLETKEAWLSEDFQVNVKTKDGMDSCFISDEN